MNTVGSLVSLHLAGEDQTASSSDLTLDTLPGKFTLTRTDAAPVREVVHSLTLAALVEGKRFCHVRWLTDDPAIATIMNLERVRGEDALPRLAKEMSVEQMRDWMQQPQTELYAALPERFVADWDSTVNTRYGHQEDAAAGYNPRWRNFGVIPPSANGSGSIAGTSASARKPSWPGTNRPARPAPNTCSNSN